MFKGLTEFFEKLPNLALRISVPLLVVGFLLMAALRAGYVGPSDLAGYPKQSAPVIIIAGIGLFITGFIFAIPGWFGRLKAKADRAERLEKDRTRLQQNVNFLSPHAQLLLLMMVQLPSGRSNVTGQDPFTAELFRQGILHTESSGVYASGIPLGMAYIDEHILSDKEALIRDVGRHLTETMGFDVMDMKLAGNEMQRARRDYRASRGLFGGS